MPGLRSLVARRRSSLTSPPYTLQRNTPSPSLSDTSDHVVTPHTSEGGDSPMTERGATGGEAQGTQEQYVGVASPTVKDSAHGSLLINGEAAQQRNVCAENVEQEKGYSNADNIEKEEDGKVDLSTSEVCANEENKKSSLASETITDSFSSAQGKILEQDKPALSTSSEDAEQLNTFVSASEGERGLCSEPVCPESITSGQVATLPESHDGNILETEGTENLGESEIIDNKGEVILKDRNEIQEKVEDSSSRKELNENVLRVACLSKAGENDEPLGDGVSSSDVGGGERADGEASEQMEEDVFISEEEAQQKEESLNAGWGSTHKDENPFNKLESVQEGVGHSCVEGEVSSGKTEALNITEGNFCQKFESFVSEQCADKEVKPNEKISKHTEARTEDAERITWPNVTEKTEKNFEHSDINTEMSEKYGTVEKAACNEGKNGLNQGNNGKERSPALGIAYDRNNQENVSGPSPASGEGDQERETGYGREGNQLLMANFKSSDDAIGAAAEGSGNRESLPTLSDTSSADNWNLVESSCANSQGLAAETKNPENEGLTGNVTKQEEEDAAIIYESESPLSGRKAEDDSQRPASSSSSNTVVSKLNQKNTKGGKRCSDLSAMEIESTLASRGVTIVRRVVDNKEAADTGKNDMKAFKKEAVTSVRPLVKGLYGKSVQPYTRGATGGIGGTSVSLRSSSTAQTTSLASKDLYRSINARGTHIQSGSKINPALLSRKGSFQLTRGVSIHYNPKSAASNLNIKGNTVYPNLKGVGAVGTRGPRASATPRGPGLQSFRGYPSNLRPRGPGLPQTRRGALQTNIRGLATPINPRGMLRPQRFTGPRGTLPKSQQPASGAPSPAVRGVSPQRFRGGMNQHQPRPTGLLPQMKSTGEPQIPKSGETALQSRSATMPPQSKYMKTSPHSRSADVNLQSKLNSDKLNMPLQSKAAGLSPQARPPDTLHSPQPGSAEVSPQSRTTPFSPQSLLTGIQPPSEYGGSSQPRTAEQSPQPVLSLPSTVVTSQAGPAGHPSQPVSASHSALPSSVQHLSQMSMMDHSPQSSTMGIPPHSGANRLPPHSVSGGFMSQTSSLNSSQVMPSHLVTSDRYVGSAGSAEFSSIPNSEFLGRPGSEMFPSYSNPGEYSPHSTTSGFPHMSSGDFSMQSTPGGFPAQNNLIGFPAQNDPCGYSQHTGSGEFSPHNSAGVVGQTSSESFAPHPSCSSFPAPGTPGGYASNTCTDQFNAQTNSGSFRENADVFSYPGQREFMMHTNSRDYSHYNNSNQMASHQLLQPPLSTTPGHRDLTMNQNSRDLPMQNCNQELSLQSSAVNSSLGGIIGDQYSQSSYGESLAHSTYQETPVNTRTNPNTVPLVPNFRDSVTPHYNSYRETNLQEDMRASQMHAGYRDMQLEPNMDLQAHVPSRVQSMHSNFKDQQTSSRYREDGIISRYLEQSVLNYPETSNLSSCREQPVSNFGSPASHTSPNEQVLSSCRENMNHMNYSDMNDATSRQQVLPGLGEPMNYGGYRGPLEYNTACGQSNPNLRESLNYVSNCRDPSNIEQVTKHVSDGLYKDQLPVSNYNVNSQHLSMEGVQNDLKYKDKDINYPENAILPSFTESFDHTTTELSGKKDGSSSIPSFRSSSDLPYQRNLPEYTNAAGSYGSHVGDASSSVSKNYSYPCLSDSKNSGPRESTAYSGLTSSCNTYSPGQSCSSDDIHFVGSSGEGFETKSDFHIPGDSLVPPDKEILEFPVSQDCPISSTNNTQGNSTAKSVPHSSDISNAGIPVPPDSSSVSSNTALDGVHNEAKFSEKELLKNSKGTSSSSLSAHTEIGESSRLPECDNLSKSPKSYSVGSPEKFPPGMSPMKSDSGSPSTQDRIVIKMKLLHSNSAVEEDTPSAENANITEVGLATKSSIKYNLAKYTRWTIDSIINGREDPGNEELLGRDHEFDMKEELEAKEERKVPLTASPKRTRKRKSSETCEDSKDPNLDTNKNLMKKSLKITITNPLRSKVASEEVGDDVKVKEESRDDVVTLEVDDKEGDGDVQSLTSSSADKESESQLHHYATRKGKVKQEKSSSPSPSAENCSGSTSSLPADSDSKKCSRSSEVSRIVNTCKEVNDNSTTSDVKKCSIVIKRIYTNDNFSCYSSSLCDKKTVLSIDDGTQRRSKRRAAVEASEKCHKTLRSLDTNDHKSGKVSQSGALVKNKNILSVNLTTNKTIVNQIPQCSVLLYDVFMNRRINEMVCPGCSRHYDSSDSIQVNMNKGTISLLCSSCQWLVVKDVHPQEVDSLVPS